MGKWMPGLILLLWCARAASGQEVIFDLKGAPDGSYYFKLDVRGGQTTVTQIRTVVTLQNPTSPPGRPDVPLPGGLASRVATWAAGASDAQAKQTAAVLAVIYNDAARRLASGELKTGDDAIQYVRFASDTVLRQRGVRDGWAAFRVSVGDELNNLRQQGPVNWNQFLTDVATGLNAYAGLSGREALDLEQLLRLLMVLFELLRDLGVFGR